MKYLALADINLSAGNIRVTGYNPKKIGYARAGGWETRVWDENGLRTVFAMIVQGLRTNKQGIRDIEFRFRYETDISMCMRLMTEVYPELRERLMYRNDESLIDKFFNWYPEDVEWYPCRLIYRMKLNSTTGRYVTHLNNPWCEVGLH